MNMRDLILMGLIDSVLWVCKGILIACGICLGFKWILR